MQVLQKRGQALADKTVASIADIFADFYPCTHICAQGFYVLATLSNNSTGILWRKKKRFDEKVKKTAMQSQQLMCELSLFTLLWSSTRSSTISSVLRERLKACSSSMSSAGRLPKETGDFVKRRLAVTLNAVLKQVLGNCNNIYINIKNTLLSFFKDVVTIVFYNTKQHKQFRTELPYR